MESTPLAVDTVPFPAFKSPRHCAVAVRFIVLMVSLGMRKCPLECGYGSLARPLQGPGGGIYGCAAGILGSMEDLAGKVALVTGAGRGIGRGIAVGLARAGCDVAINYFRREGDAQDAALEVQQAGKRAFIVRADVSHRTEVEALVQSVESQLGPIEILVNNAGIARVQKIEEIREEDWNELIAVNLTSCFLVTQAVLPGMRARQWGRIINISSVAAQAGSIVGPHYAASKAGMLGLTRGYAKLLAKEGITVNAIAPALIETEMVSSNPNARTDLIPVGRFGHIEEVADVAVMLAGNPYITGQTVNVNGGWYMS